MKYGWTWFFLLCIALGLSCNGPEGVRRVQLENGMTILLNNTPDVDVVSALLLVRAGSITDTDSTQGLARLVQHSLFHQSRHCSDVQMEIASVAARYFSGLHPDFAYFGLTAEKKYLYDVTHIIQETIQEAVLSDSLAAAGKYRLRQEIRRMENNPRLKLNDAFRKTLFRKHPYRYSGWGSEHSLSRIALKDLQNFYELYYVPANMVLVVSGDLQLKELSAYLIETLETGEKKRPPLKTWQPQWNQAEKQKQIFYHQYEQDLAFVSLGWNAPCIQNKATYSMDILLACLGIGESSRLNIQVRDKLPDVYFTWAEYVTTREPGYFVMNAICHPDRVDDVKQAFLDEIKIIQHDSITPDELKRTQQYFQSFHTYQHEDVVGASFSLGYWAALSDYSFAQSYTENLKKITLDDIKKMSSTFFSTDVFTECVLLPGRAVQGGSP